MNNNELINARHIKKTGLPVGKEYTWSVPEYLKGTLKIGDKVLVRQKADKKIVKITGIRIEENRDIVNSHSSVISLYRTYSDKVEICAGLIGTVWSKEITDKLTKKLMVVGSNMTSLIMGDGRKVRLEDLEKEWIKIR